MTLVADYNQRTRLRKLGFSSDLEKLDQITADAFIAISIEVDKLEEAEAKKREAKAKSKKSGGRI